MKGGESQLEKWSSLIGIVTAIIGNVLISFALNIQRYAHIRLHNEYEEKRGMSRADSKTDQRGYGSTGAHGKARASGDDEESNGRDSPDSDETMDQDEHHSDPREGNYLRSPYWWAGITMMTVGEAGNFIAYGFAPASIVSPLGVVALISNCIIAPIMLKEKFRWRDFWGVLVAIGGAVTVVLSARQEERRLGPHEVLDAITTTAFEVYMGVTVGLIILLMWASPKYGSTTVLIDLGLVGLFGGYTALSTKGIASMLSSTLWKAFTTPVTYALVAVLVGTAVMQVRYINRALQRFNSTQVIPVQFVMFTISVIVGSAVLYRDFEQADAAQFGKFIGGCLLTFFGVFLITSGRSKEEDDEESSDDEEDEGEERIGLHYQDTNDSSITASGYADDIDHKYESDRSRRGSKVSFAVPRPHTPQVQSSASSIVPSVRVSSVPRESETTPLLANAWKEHTDDLLSAERARTHPGLPTTASSPLLPTETSLSQSPTPARGVLSRSNSQNNPHTHPTLQSNGPPQPDALSAQRPATPLHSLSSRILPGPYLSPLSSSLSAVVADTLRRKPSYRRPKLGLRRSKSGSHRLSNTSGDEGEGMLGTSPGKSLGATRENYLRRTSSRAVDDQSESGTLKPKQSRARSLSNTIGDMLRGKRQRRESDEEHGNDTDWAGPSSQT